MISTENPMGTDLETMYLYHPTAQSSPSGHNIMTEMVKTPVTSAFINTTVALHHGSNWVRILTAKLPVTGLDCLYL